MKQMAWALVGLVIGVASVGVAENGRLVGTISKNQRSEYVTFDFRLESGPVLYHVDGNTTVNPGLYRSDVNYGGVRVTKVTDDEGRIRRSGLRNGGTMQVHPRRRTMVGVTFADVPVSGYYIQGMFNRGMFWDNLVVGETSSCGALDYVIINGHYNAIRGCGFGPYPITSTTPGSRMVMNRNNYIGQNQTLVTLAFGDLRLNGTIQFTDITRSTGGENSTEVLAARTANLQLQLTRRDGMAPRFAPFGRAETDDDRAARHLIAMLELLSYDLFVQ